MRTPLILGLFLLSACTTYVVPPTTQGSLTSHPEPTPSAPPTTQPTAVSPTTTTTTTVAPTTTLAPQPLVIHGTGDVALDPSYIPSFRSNGYEDAFSGLEGLFANDSLTVINLECPIARSGSIWEKAFNFRCDPAAIPAMVEAGVDVANQGNNHILDFGYKALEESLNQLRGGGIYAVGAGLTPAEAYQASYIRVSDLTVGVLGFGGVSPGSHWLVSESHPGMASGDDTALMVAAVEAASANADIVVVTIHWGWELDREPRQDDIDRATAMIDAGADIIFGHHQHRLQPMSWYNDRPIFWGLGNFVWPRLSAASADTAVAEVVISPEGEIVEACLIPATIVRSGHPTLDEPYTGCDGIESAVFELP